MFNINSFIQKKIAQASYLFNVGLRYANSVLFSSDINETSMVLIQKEEHI